MLTNASAFYRFRVLAAWLLGLSLLAAPAWGVETLGPAIFLVAKPELLDPNFAQSVVLVVFPKDAGPVGVILNRPVPLTLKDVFSEEPRLRGRGDQLYFGGPVHVNALMFLFRRADAPQNAFPIVGDLYLSGDGGLLDEMLSRSDGQVQRFFLGYSGLGHPAARLRDSRRRVVRRSRGSGDRAEGRPQDLMARLAAARNSRENVTGRDS